MKRSINELSVFISDRMHGKATERASRALSAQTIWNHSQNLSGRKARCVAVGSLFYHFRSSKRSSRESYIEKHIFHSGQRLSRSVQNNAHWQKKPATPILHERYTPTSMHKRTWHRGPHLGQPQTQYPVYWGSKTCKCHTDSDITRLLIPRPQGLPATI